MTYKKEPTSKNVLKRVDLELFFRFLTIISKVTSIRITSLQMKTRTNHDACIKYVTLLEKFELAKLVTDGKNKEICITEMGKKALKIMSSYFQ